MATKPWRARDCVQWVYERKEGNIEVYARTQLEAWEAIRSNGFNCPDIQKIIRGDGNLMQHLKKEEIT